MTILPLQPADTQSRAALERFLGQCRERAVAAGRAQLVSITIECERLDPLAVLESIYEPGELHFYAERPAADVAVAGAEAVVACECSGQDRFSRASAFVRDTLDHAIAIGPVDLPFGGPLFFATFGFGDETSPETLFPAARVFVPRWQVARTAEGSVAVANTLVEPDTDIEAAAQKIWRAHAKFSAFDYQAPAFAGVLEGEIATENEVGPAGGYAATVARAVETIRSGRYQKIVVARARDLRATTQFHPLRALNELRQRYSDCYAFSAGNGAGASFIGASPERLVAVASGKLRTEALAGTTSRGRTAGEDAALARQLLQSEKDLHEHRIVLESILRRLERVGVRAPQVSRPRVRQLSNVQHLATLVEAELPADMDVLQVVGELHPTPAVGGTPREAAVADVPRLEPFPRGLYAGALGWVNHAGNGEFFVGIRSALMQGDVARIYAGAGIVEGSVPEREFEETELKMRALRGALLGTREAGR